MDIQRMQYEFGIQINQFDKALELTSDDIEYWLNKAQIELIKEKFNGRNETRRGFEQSPQTVEDLRVLLQKNYEETATEDIVPLNGFSSYQATLPGDTLFLLNLRANVTYTHQSTDKTKIVSVRFATQDTVYKMMDDPFNTTKVGSPIADVSGYLVTIYSKTFSIDKVLMNYIRVPREMSIIGDVDCELPEHLHKEIIQRAVDLFLYNTRELKQRLQRETPVATTTQNTQNNE